MSFVPNADDLKAINTIRTLALDTVNKANSGHPGAPMGMAPAAHVLFSRFMSANPANPHWLNRDRFVLSNGHACALQYVLLHLLGYKVSLDDLKSFRQLDSICPGHPENGVTPGIEVTTGPLGQGIANAVGLAIAEAHLAATFNKEGYEIFNNYTFAFCGDGCLQEGVSAEAASLAGHLQLGKLIMVYDDNKITIDGSTDVSFTEDVGKRFESYGWEVLYVDDGNADLASIHAAIAKAKATTDKPTIIKLKTIIGFGSKDQGTHGVHGNPLKKDDTVNIKNLFGFNPEEFFVVPEETKKLYGDIASKGAEAEAKWNALFEEYKGKYPAEAADIARRQSGKLPEGWEKVLPTFKEGDAAVATRKLSENLLAVLADAIPELVSGSADLTPSNLTRWKTATDFQPPQTGLGTYAGRYIRYGVREHGMGAIMNGIAAYGPGLIIPAAGTFLNFVSYAAGAVRLAALSHLRTIWVATHDSIGLGEDGPTHQPVETVAHFRAMPNIDVWRPADGNETSGAYKYALEAIHNPSILALTRQNLPQLAGSSIEKAVKGGYVVLSEEKKADLVFVSTGSEVSIAIEAAEILKKKGLSIRVVSIPCLEVFKKQSREYQLEVLPDGAPIVSVEAYSTFGWGELSHEHIGLPSWGASAPAVAVYKKFGITGEAIAEKGEKVISFYKNLGHGVYSPLNRALA